MIFPVFYLVAILFGALGLAGAIVAGSAQRKTWLMIKEAKAEGLLPAAGPYRSPALLPSGDGGGPREVMVMLESKVWTRSARDNDNLAPWDYVHGSFVLTTRNDLLFGGSPIGIPPKWVKGMRKRLEREMNGKSDGPTRRGLLAEAKTELEKGASK